MQSNGLSSENIGFKRPLLIAIENPSSPQSNSKIHNKRARDNCLKYTDSVRKKLKYNMLNVYTNRSQSAVNSISDSNGYMKFTFGLILCNKYKIIRQLGRGTFSNVFECYHSNNKYAVKVIRNLLPYQLASQVELVILRKIRKHDPDNTSNCIHFLDDWQHHGHRVIIFPLLSRSIYSFLVDCKYKPFNYNNTISIMYQIFTAVNYVHSLSIIITDLKTDNIVLVSDKIIPDTHYSILVNTKIKLIDFGTSIMNNYNNGQHTQLIQTRHYRAPEVIFKMFWSYSADIWSIGCILVELIYGKLLFYTHNDIDHLNQMVKCIGPPPNYLLQLIDDNTWNDYFDYRGALRMNKAKISPIQCQKLSSYFSDLDNNKQSEILYDLCCKMLCWNAQDRITAKDALKHKVFHDYLL